MRRALGKGLSQLIAEQHEAAPTELPIEAVVPNARQPRSRFNDATLEELAASVREFGILQPLVVRPQAEGTYELIAGERRLRAARLAGLRTVPVVLRAADNRDTLELALIENLQREDINALECARAYRRLIDEFGLTQELVADKVGKSRTAVANTVRLLRLPARVQAGLEEGRITEGHARALLAFPDADGQLAMYDQILARGLSVREVERAAAPRPEAKPTPKEARRDPNLRALESGLADHFGTPVRLAGRPGAGRLTIEYTSDDDLQRILDRIGFRL